MSRQGCQTASLTVSVIFFLLLLVFALVCQQWRTGRRALVEKWTIITGSSNADVSKRSTRFAGVAHLEVRLPGGGTASGTSSVNPTNSWWPQARKSGISHSADGTKLKKTNYHWVLDMEKVKLGGPEKITCSGRGASVE